MASELRDASESFVCQGPKESEDLQTTPLTYTRHIYIIYIYHYDISLDIYFILHVSRLVG